MTEQRKDNKRIAALTDAEPEDVFRKMFREADKKIRPELRKRPRQQEREKRNAGKETGSARESGE